MARDQKIYETNNYGGGVLVDRTTELPVGFTAQGVDQYMVIPVADPLTGGISFYAAGQRFETGGTYTQRLNALAQGGRVRLHVYGNSMLAAINSHVASALAASAGRLQVVQNSAVTSYTSADILAKLAVDGVNPLCDAVIFQEGTNDAVASVSNLQHLANIRQFISVVVAAGKIPILILTPPTDSASYIDQMNQYALRQWVLARSLDIPCFDPFLRYRDTDGSWTAGASSDTIHPINAVYSQAGADLWAGIAGQKLTVVTPSKNAGFGILGTNNVLHLTDSNTDGFPDGWSSVLLDAPTYTAPSFAYPFLGKKASVAVSQTSMAAVYKNISTGFSGGDLLKLTGVLGLVTPTNMILYCYIQCKDVGGTVLLKNTVWASAQALANIVFEHDFVVPATTTLMELYIVTDTATTGAYSGTFEFGDFELYNVTTLLAS